jgi:hypothetical protein
MIAVLLVYGGRSLLAISWSAFLNEFKAHEYIQLVFMTSQLVTMLVYRGVAWISAHREWWRILICPIMSSEHTGRAIEAISIFKL